MGDDQDPEKERLAEIPRLVIPILVDLIDIAHGGRIDDGDRNGNGDM